MPPDWFVICNLSCDETSCLHLQIPNRTNKKKDDLQFKTPAPAFARVISGPTNKFSFSVEFDIITRNALHHMIIRNLITKGSNMGARSGQNYVTYFFNTRINITDVRIIFWSFINNYMYSTN